MFFFCIFKKGKQAKKFVINCQTQYFSGLHLTGIHPVTNSLTRQFIHLNTLISILISKL